MEAGWEGKGDSARKNGRNNNQAGRRIDEYAINRVYACTYTAGLTLPSPSTPTPTAIQRASCGREDENENENGSRARRPIGGRVSGLDGNGPRGNGRRTTDNRCDGRSSEARVTKHACARGIQGGPGKAFKLRIPSIEERVPRPADPRKAKEPAAESQTD